MDERLARRRSRRQKSRCVDCEHAIFDELWGEYKCKIKKRRVEDPNEYTDCKTFKKIRSGHDRNSDN